MLDDTEGIRKRPKTQAMRDFLRSERRRGGRVSLFERTETVCRLRTYAHKWLNPEGGTVFEAASEAELIRVFYLTGRPGNPVERSKNVKRIFVVRGANKSIRLFATNQEANDYRKNNRGETSEPQEYPRPRSPKQWMRFVEFLTNS